MQNRKKACGVLGLTEEAGEKEIEDRYFFLMKRYKYVDPTEQPSSEEPIFAVINEAYRFLIGYAPLQHVVFRELSWNEKVQHIRDNYMMEITFSVVLVLFIFIVGIGVNELYWALHAGVKDVGVYSPVEFPISEYAGKK
jgi:hypothetical protein